MPSDTCRHHSRRVQPVAVVVRGHIRRGACLTIFKRACIINPEFRDFFGKRIDGLAQPVGKARTVVGHLSILLGEMIQAGDRIPHLGDEDL